MRRFFASLLEIFEIALVALGGVVVASVLVGGLGGELLGSLGLGLGVEVLDLSLTEDAVPCVSIDSPSNQSLLTQTYIQVLLFGLL